MDIYLYLQNDYQLIRKLMKRIHEIGVSNDALRLKYFYRLREEVLLHVRSKQRIFYDHLKALTVTRRKVMQRELDLQEIDMLFKELSNVSLRGSIWMKRYHVLSDLLEHHITKEEHTLLNASKKMLTAEEGKAMVQDMEREKDEEYNDIYYDNRMRA